MTNTRTATAPAPPPPPSLPRGLTCPGENDLPVQLSTCCELNKRYTPPDQVGTKLPRIQGVLRANEYVGSVSNIGLHLLPPTAAAAAAGAVRHT
jgi:hypothetical protein